MIVAISTTNARAQRRRQAKELALQAIRSSEVEPLLREGPETSTKTLVSPTPDELIEEFLRSSIYQQPTSAEAENKTWKGPTPEELERLQQYEEEVMSELSKTTQVIERKPTQLSYYPTTGIEDPILKKFLLEQPENQELGL